MSRISDYESVLIGKKYASGQKLLKSIRGPSGIDLEALEEYRKAANALSEWRTGLYEPKK
jgi:hypothetical protein